ncbi:NUDIX hydrolase [Luteococcus peritonei]|uniref:NUDIX domain-containing protein n=1 Tax=Luteococcus peritonei TaxID=88874 RepID=A0ABW4RXQ9_9ACTN
MGHKKGTVTAAGAVVLRENKGVTEVLVVRRPAYKDWSLPKGKPKTDEDLPATAVREVLEETGVTVTLGQPVKRTRYKLDKQTKVVHWWVGRVVSERRRRPDKEVEKAVWMSVEKAEKKLSYADEVEVLHRALELPCGGTLLVVRHGKAMLRKHWSGTDAKRPLSARGRRQAKRLPALLAAFGTSELVSSSSTRCLQTLQPAAEAAKLPLAGISLLSEEEAEGHEKQVRAFMRELAHQAGREHSAIAVCGHRPVLPDMREGIGVADAAMLTGETLVVHLDEQGEVLSTETHKSAF